MVTLWIQSLMHLPHPYKRNKMEEKCIKPWFHSRYYYYMPKFLWLASLSKHFCYMYAPLYIKSWINPKLIGKTCALMNNKYMTNADYCLLVYKMSISIWMMLKPEKITAYILVDGYFGLGRLGLGHFELRV